MKRFVFCCRSLVAMIGLTGLMTSQVAFAGSCEVKVDGKAIKTVEAKDRNDCYKQTSFGSRNCDVYASSFKPGVTSLLEQYFQKTDRVNSDRCTGKGTASTTPGRVVGEVKSVGVTGKPTSVGCSTVRCKAGTHCVETSGRAECVPDKVSCTVTSNNITIVATDKYSSKEACLADPNFKNDMICLNVSRAPKQFPPPKDYTYVIAFGQSAIGRGICKTGPAQEVKTVDALPMQAGNEKTPCPSIGTTYDRATAASVPYFKTAGALLDKSCAARIGAGFKLLNVTTVKCAPDARKGFGPNAVIKLSCVK